MEGFSVGTGGAFVLLLFYKVLGGYWFIEGEQPQVGHRRTRRTSRVSSRRRRRDYAFDDEY